MTRLQNSTFEVNLGVDRQTHSFLSTQACVQTANEGIDSLLALSLEMTDVTGLFKHRQRGDWI